MTRVQGETSALVGNGFWMTGYTDHPMFYLGLRRRHVVGEETDGHSYRTSNLGQLSPAN